jgi:hypothetical protein
MKEAVSNLREYAQWGLDKGILIDLETVSSEAALPISRHTLTKY